MLRGLNVSMQKRGSVWKKDFTSSVFWNSEKYGITIDNCESYKALREYDTLVDLSKYDFIITEEVWVNGFCDKLELLRNRGKKIFLISKEPFKSDTPAMQKAYFFHKRWVRPNGDHFFIPDAVLTPGTMLDEWWRKYSTCAVYLTGYPRFDYYNEAHPKLLREEIIQKYGLAKNKKIILFADYNAFIYVEPTDGIDPDIGKVQNSLAISNCGYNMSLMDVREETFIALEKFAQEHKDYQVILKVHPISFRDKRDSNEFSGILKQYYEHPTEYMKTIGESWDSCVTSRELLVVADIVSGWCSTMLLEGMLLHKPIVHVLFGKTKALNLFADYEKNFSTAYCEKDLSGAIINAKDSYNETLVEKYFYKNDGKTCERICEAIRIEMDKGKAPSGAKLRPEMIPEDTRVVK